MRESEFWAAVDWVYPNGRGHSLAEDLVLSALGDVSPREALDAGENPQRVWEAMCDAMDLPSSYYFINRVKPEDRDRLVG
ncbi:DUF3046 domain-containing protein [Changpingibacter yushuensis]|uniref:DUF3046 domain-containing protein n=1 Tax=Changpingibacter yushuensis TaxID=2758440 RepID=UPI0015F71FE9|nr:DUF3046 domain-containing protein [Changpingibacter yushuensis]